MPCGENTMGAQTFTTSVSYTISSIKLKLFRTGTPDLVTISIRPTDINGKPTSDVLCSGTINGDSLPEEAEWIEIEMDTPVLLSSSTKYAIVLGSVSEYVNWRFDSGESSYDSGDVCYSSDNGSSWDLYSGMDAMFEIWGY